MNSLTSILLSNFRLALARHGREVSIVSLRAGGTGRGNYVAATGGRDGLEATYTVKALRGPDQESMVGGGSATERTYSCLTADLPLVDGRRLIPGKGWLIVDIVDDETEQEETLSVVRAEPAIDGQSQRMVCERKK